MPERRQVDDGQAAMAQHYASIVQTLDAIVVGSPMTDRVRNPANSLCVDAAAPIDDSRNSAHACYAHPCSKRERKKFTRNSRSTSRAPLPIDCEFRVAHRGPRHTVPITDRQPQSRFGIVATDCITAAVEVIQRKIRHYV